MRIRHLFIFALILFAGPLLAVANDPGCPHMEAAIPMSPQCSAQCHQAMAQTFTLPPAKKQKPKQAAQVYCSCKVTGCHTEPDTHCNCPGGSKSGGGSICGGSMGRRAPSPPAAIAAAYKCWVCGCQHQGCMCNDTDTAHKCPNKS